jgi:hypothetical protein
LEIFCILTVYLPPSTPAEVFIFLLLPSALSMSAVVFMAIRLQKLFGYEMMSSEGIEFVGSHWTLQKLRIVL